MKHALMILVAVLSAVSWPSPVDAQIVRGEVVDSLTDAPLSGVSVRLLDETGAVVDSATTDASGLFVLYGTTAGEYRVHVEFPGYRVSTFPAFSLAIDDVRGFRLLLSSLTEVPRITAAEVIANVCEPGSVAQGQGVILGFVRDENGDPAADAEVSVSWPPVLGELAALMHGDALQDVAAVIVTDTTGFYAACGVPRDVVVRFHASRDDLLSRFGAVQFVDGGVVSDAQFHASDEGVWVQDLVLLPADGRTGEIAGRVMSREGQPVPRAVVRAAATPIETTADTLGNFVLRQLPAGLVKLTVRAVGFRETDMDVELEEGERVQLDAGLLQLEDAPTELAPIAVVGAAPETRRPLEEFNERRKSASGMFITRDEFIRQGNPQTPTDVLRRMGGVKIIPNPGYAGVSNTPRFLIVMTRAASRGTFGGSSSGATCAPIAFLDGLFLGRTNAIDVDGLINVNNIEAVEAYASTAGLPQEFNRPGATCGVIVFWSR